MSEHAEFERLLDEYATAQAQHWEHSRNFGQEENRATLLAYHERVVRERDNWQETAARHWSNELFYSGLLRDVGSLFPDCYVSDDGSVQDQPLALKVKECVQAALAERDARIAELELDANRLNWMDVASFTAYRRRDPEHGRLDRHAVVVNEDACGSRSGHIGNIREAIDAARKAEQPAKSSGENG